MCCSSVFQALRLACLLCAALLLGTEATARAAERRAVFLESAQNAHPSLDSVLEATRAPLAELGVELAVAPRPAGANLGTTAEAAKALARSQQAVAVVWLDTERAGATWSVLYFFDAARSRLLTRRVAVSASESAAAEEVAVVLRSAIGALLEGQEVLMTEVPVPEVKKEPPTTKLVKPRPVAPPPARPHAPEMLGLGLSYVGSIFNEGASWQSGARVSLSVRPFRSRWRFAAAYEFLPALDASAPGITTQVTRHPSEVTVARDLFTGTLRLAPELGVIADAVHRRTEFVEAPLVATEPSTRWLWAVSMRFRGTWSVATRVSLLAALGADFVLNPFEQVAAEGAREASVSTLLAVRPRAEAGFLLNLW
jgi:hypothetical protein